MTAETLKNLQRTMALYVCGSCPFHDLRGAMIQAGIKTLTLAWAGDKEQFVISLEKEGK